MFKNRTFTLVTILTFLCCSCSSQEKQVEEKETQEIDIKKISEAFGHFIGKSIELHGFEFDRDQIVKGFQDQQKGLESPLSEREYMEAVAAIEEASFEKLASENMEKSIQFLEENKTHENVITLEENKLQYLIENPGSGEAVTASSNPLITYKGSFLDGTVFGQSEEPEQISLDETIPGFSQGLIGMQEGEKRTLYIHPDLGYGTNGVLPPNSLLTFEIELIKADSVELSEIASAEIEESIQE